MLNDGRRLGEVLHQWDDYVWVKEVTGIPNTWTRSALFTEDR